MKKKDILFIHADVKIKIAGIAKMHDPRLMFIYPSVF